MLATQYEWADRRPAPVRNAALDGEADSVKSWLRILLSLLGVCLDKWWLMGGWGTGATLMGSGVIAFAMLLYSYLDCSGFGLTLLLTIPGARHSVRCGRSSPSTPSLPWPG